MNKEQKKNCSNYMSLYNIPNTNLGELEDQIGKENCCVYRKICQLIESSRVTCHDN